MANSVTLKSESPRQPLRVFLCHASNDKPRVRELYRRLKADGFDVWLDEERLLPGQDWQREIAKAVRISDVVIVCLSPISVSKAGYVQNEIKFSLDIADEQPEGTIFLIPLKLQECQVPERLHRWQWVNLFDKLGYEKLVRALRSRAKSLQLADSRTSIFGRIKRYLRSLRMPEVIVVSLTLIAVAVAALNWLLPFNPVGTSPFAPRTEYPTGQPTLASIPSTYIPSPSATSTADLSPTALATSRISENPATGTGIANLKTAHTPTLSQAFTVSMTPSNTPKPLQTHAPPLLETPTPANPPTSIIDGDSARFIGLSRQGSNTVILSIRYQLVTSDVGIIHACLGSYPDWKCGDTSVNRGFGIADVGIDWPCPSISIIGYNVGLYTKNGATLSPLTPDDYGIVQEPICPQ